MASFPQHQRPQQRPLSTLGQAPTPTEAYPQIRRQSSQSPSTTSIDSQTLLLSNTEAEEEEQQHPDPSRQQNSESNDEVLKCWICFSDETEDNPRSSPWRSPCPCALTAHESCLLDWIADLEAPDPSRSIAATSEIRCPQCKGEIHLARPKNRVVETVNALEKLKSRLLLPASVIGVTYTMVLAASHHGAHTVRMIFGSDDAALILEPIRDSSWFERQLLERLPSLARSLFRDWRGLRVEIGLPLIPLALVASRTTLADALLPILPIVFFATTPETADTLNIGYWPPSAALTLVVLPYFRAVYDEYLERVWGPHEKRWLKEILPRIGQENNDDGQARAEARVAPQPGEVDVEFELVIEEELEPATGADHGQAPALNDPPLDAQAQQAQAPPLAQPAPAVHRAEVNLMETIVTVADNVFGALLFPSIAAAMGKLILYSLPSRLTVAPVVFTRVGRAGKWQAVPTGLLQTRWGRSIIGGCLFVVLKDAVRIYCRWKMAQSHRERRVLDWDKKAGRVIE